MNTYFDLDSNNALDFQRRQKGVDNIELTVSNNDLRNNRVVAFLEEKLKFAKTASSLKSRGVSFLTLFNLFRVSL